MVGWVARRGGVVSVLMGWRGAERGSVEESLASLGSEGRIVAW